MNLKKAILLGTGALTWDVTERRSDRYGTVTVADKNSLDQTIEEGSHLNEKEINELEGRHGKLVAEVLKKRKSTHIGDLFRHIYPTTPKKGDIILLGEGKLFLCNFTWCKAVGVIPRDKRNKDWLNPYMLYRCHEQTVNLYFIPHNS